jgi:hypothetical protein
MRSTPEEALAIFDALEPVGTDFMLGAWQGAGFPTGHPLDGVLEAYHWHGKRFDSVEHAHPLVFRSVGGARLSLHTMWVPLAVRLLQWLPFLKSRAAGRIARLVFPLLASRRSGARLRMTRHRGQSTATMVYDRVPINDVFRKVDADTVLGLMDMKGMERPFFFMLRREPLRPAD